MSVLNAVLLVLTPAEPLHEATHCLAAYPWARRVQIERSGLNVHARLEWRGGTPTIAVRAAHLAPTLLGVLVALLCVPALPWMLAVINYLGARLASLLGAPGAAEECALLLTVVLAVNWLVYSWPSPSDRRPFSGE